MKSKSEELVPEKEGWGERFDAKLKELRSDYDCIEKGKTKIHEFGYRTMRDNEIFTVPDWGNIKKFIKEERHRAVEEYDRTLSLDSIGKYHREYHSFQDARKKALSDLGGEGK